MKEVKKRILWVDIAKALTILSVIISHTIRYESTLRAMIFSFHMPLFFILSGYTTHPAKDKATFIKRLKKNFKYLILPTFFVLFIFALTEALRFGGIHLIFEKIIWTLREFFLMEHPYGLYNASAVWFLVALFTAKIIMDLVNIFVKSDKNSLIFFGLGILGICMGVFGHALPFFIDLSFVAVMFMEIGVLWRKYEPFIKKYTPILLAVSGVYWFSQAMRGVYLELWARFYAGYEVSILTAIAGTFLVSNFAMMLEECLKKAGKVLKPAINSLVTLGRNTMLLYIIHCLDTSLFSWLWDVRESNFGGRWCSLIVVFLRLALNLSLFVIVYQGIKFAKKHKRY